MLTQKQRVSTPAGVHRHGCVLGLGSPPDHHKVLLGSHKATFPEQITGEHVSREVKVRGSLRLLQGRHLRWNRQHALVRSVWAQGNRPKLRRSCTSKCLEAVSQLREQSLENTVLRQRSRTANHSIETKMTIYISTGRFGL